MASQRATMKYFFVVVALWGVQILMGVLTAHYGVEGGGFYGSLDFGRALEGDPVVLRIWFAVRS